MDLFRYRWRLAAGLVILSLALGGCTDANPITADSEAPTTTTTSASASAPTGWSRGEDFPLTARGASTIAWTGAEILVIGGETGPPCPPFADCLSTGYERDGAAYDPRLDSWREIADAPFDIPPGSTAAFADGRLFINVPNPARNVLLSYDVDADLWERWDDVPDALPGNLVADGERILFVSGSDEPGPVVDRVLDVSTGVWSELPADPLGLSFDRVITPTPAGLVLTANELSPSPGSEDPSTLLAALYDRENEEWARLPDTGQIGGWRWTWTGARLISPELGGADGGQVDNWGRTYPFGGVLTLPNGVWSPLSNAPDQRPGWIDHAAGGGRFVVGSGYVYDDKHFSWTAIDQPTGAPAESGGAIWAADQLIVFGGTDWAGINGTDWTEINGTRSTQTWIYTPQDR